MPTERPRVTITVTEDQLAQIDDYRFSNKFKNQTQAILSLIEAGIEKLENSGSLTKKPPSISGEAQKLAKDYDALDIWGKKQLRLTADLQLSRCRESVSGPGCSANLIPFLRSIQPVSAGTGAYLGPEEFETIFVEDNALTRRASFGVPVKGSSMEPLYHDGDVLIVEGANDIDIGEIGVFTVNGSGFVKKRGDGVLISLNPKYAPVKLTEESWCNGRVIGLLDPKWIGKM